MRESNASLSVDRTASSAPTPLEALGLRCDRGAPKLSEGRIPVALGNVPEVGSVVRGSGGGGEEGGGYRRVGGGLLMLCRGVDIV